jgi:hypothetical protein
MAPDPVLFRTDDTAEAFIGRALEEHPVDLKQIIQPEVASFSPDGDRPLHRSEVAKDSQGSHVGNPWLILRDREPLVRRSEALDKRGPEGLSSQKWSDQSLKVVGFVDLEIGESGGGRSDGIRGAPRERTIPFANGIRNVGLVSEGPAVTARPITPALP